jgi:hypothetical protein
MYRLVETHSSANAKPDLVRAIEVSIPRCKSSSVVTAINSAKEIAMFSTIDPNNS